jgi:hypothetical protein
MKRHILYFVSAGMIVYALIKASTVSPELIGITSLWFMGAAIFECVYKKNNKQP